MPIDRPNRDAATEALAAFLRHETGFEALATAFDDLKNEIDEGVIAISKDDSILIEMLETVFEYGNRDKPMPEKQWLEMCRYLAFLRTDLDVNSCQQFLLQKEKSYEALLARWHTFGLVVFLGVAYLTHWWILAVAVLISITHFAIMSQRKRKSLQEAEYTWMTSWREYYPFADEAEWLAHRHLLDEYRIPPFDGDAFVEPVTESKWPRIFSIPLLCIGSLFVAGGVAFTFLLFVCCWPLMLASMAFRSINSSQDLPVES